MVKLATKIKAFSLLEAMVSMVIVMLVFGLSGMITVNITNSGMSREKQNAYMLVQSLRNETIKEQRFIDESIKVNDILIEKTIFDYPKNETLKVLLVEAFKGENKLSESKELIVL